MAITLKPLGDLPDGVEPQAGDEMLVVRGGAPLRVPVVTTDEVETIAAAAVASSGAAGSDAPTVFAHTITAVDTYVQFPVEADRMEIAAFTSAARLLFQLSTDNAATWLTAYNVLYGIESEARVADAWASFYDNGKGMAQASLRGLKAGGYVTFDFLRSEATRNRNFVGIVDSAGAPVTHCRIWIDGGSVGGVIQAIFSGYRG